MDLNTVWFCLLTVLVIGYAVLDGFDLGVGILHLFPSGEKEKRLNMNSIAPVWDGNEVWLLTLGGTLFAVFPRVYATVLSGFYIMIVLLITSLIFRAVSLEFRGKVDSPVWRRVWDLAFGLGSFLASFLLGLMVGNLLRGIPLSTVGFYAGSFGELLDPYALFTGLFTAVAFLVHGSNYLTLKTEGPMRLRLRQSSIRFWSVFFGCAIISIPFTMLEAPQVFAGIFRSYPAYIFLTLFWIAVIYQPFALKGERYIQAFFSSAIAVAMLIALAAAGLFPRLLLSIPFPENNLTIYNAISSPHSQFTALVVVIIGLPAVIVCTLFVYRIFKGRADGAENGY